MLFLLFLVGLIWFCSIPVFFFFFKYILRSLHPQCIHYIPFNICNHTQNYNDGARLAFFPSTTDAAKTDFNSLKPKKIICVFRRFRSLEPNIFTECELHNTQHTTLSIDRLVFPAETNQFWAVAEFNMAALLPARWPSSPLALTRILYRHSHSHGWDSIQTHSTRTGQQHTQQPHTSAKFLIQIFRRCLFLSDRFDYLQLRLMLIIFICFLGRLKHFYFLPFFSSPTYPFVSRKLCSNYSWHLFIFILHVSVDW